MLLGELLIRLRLITSAQLDAALRAQVAHGGRLGTNLLKLGYIEPDPLAAALAKLLDVRGVSIDKLSAVDEVTLRRLPAAVARRNRAIPLGLTSGDVGGRALCVAFADPRDLSVVDEVAFASGLPVLPFVASELCIMTLLDRYYPAPASEQVDATPKPKESAQQGGRVLPLRSNTVPPAKMQTPNTTGQFWLPKHMQASEKPQFSTPEMQAVGQTGLGSLEQALRVAGDLSLTSGQTGVQQALDVTARMPAPSDQHVDTGRRQTQIGHPAAERATRPSRTRSQLELDHSRSFREDDFSLPIQRPNVRELEHTDLGPHGKPQRPRPKSQEVDLSEFSQGPAVAAPHVTHPSSLLTNTTHATPSPAPTQDTRPASSQRSRPALGLREAQEKLFECFSRDAIGDVVSDFLRSAFGCGLVFVCKDDLCLGWRGFSIASPDSMIEAIVLPLATPSMLQTAYRRGSIFRGKPPEEGMLVQERLWKMLGCSAPEEVLVAPVKLGSRVVNLIYAHAFDRGAISDQSILELGEFLPAIQAAFIRLIRTQR